MVYMTVDKKDLIWSKVYCHLHDGSNTDNNSEEVIKSINCLEYVSPFYEGDHTASTDKIKDDNNMFIVKNQYGYFEVWQVGGLVSDINGTLIEHLYKVRKVANIFE